MTSGPLFFTMLFQIIEVCGHASVDIHSSQVEAWALTGPLQTLDSLLFQALSWKFVLGVIVLLCDPLPVRF